MPQLVHTMRGPKAGTVTSRVNGASAALAIVTK